MLRARPCGEIIAAFGHELEREIGSNAMDPGQILSKQGMERFADVEVRAYVSKVAQDNVKSLAEATYGARKMGRYNAARREALKPPVPPRDDVIGEMRRQELRAFARGIKMAERLPFALEHPEAILDAAPALSGLPGDQFSKVRETYLASKFGPEIAEIELLDGDLATVKAAHDLALAELRANAGMSEREFAKMVEKVTFEIDGV